MRIAIVTQSYYPRFGGVTENVHYTAAELARRGHEVVVVTSRFPGHDRAGRTPEGVEIVRLGHNVLIPFNGAYVDFTAGVQLQAKLRRLLAARRVDLVHVHNPAAPSLPLLTIDAAAAPVVGTFHMTGSNRLQTLFQEPLRRRIDRLAARIAVSPTALHCASEHFPGAYTIVPNGIDVDRFHPAVEPIAHFRTPGIANLLFVGRLDPRKGLPDLLRAMPEVVERTREAVRLLVVGDSRLRPRMEALVPDAVRHRVHFVGAVPAAELPRWYATSDVFVSPATGNESFGIVLLEAMASARAIVCSDLPGYRNAVVPDRSALVHRPGDPEGIARVLVRVVEDEALRSSLASAGRSRALEFAWPRVTDAIESVYAAALRTRSVLLPSPELTAA
jgi:phosphatidylinositol alpha-mannosyltransferase